jgi:MFS family permease
MPVHFAAIDKFLNAHSKPCAYGYWFRVWFIGVMYLAAVWFHPKRLSLISGLTTSIGIFGALIGQAPLSQLKDAVGWRSSWVYIALVGILSTLTLVFFVPETPTCEQENMESHSEDFRIKNFCPDCCAYAKISKLGLSGWLHAHCTLRL